MIAFAGLLERLTFTTDPSARAALLCRYFRAQPDPDRGYALGVLTGAVRVPSLRSGIARALAAERLDPSLFLWSHEFAGDLTEALALMWPSARGNAPPPTLADVVNTPPGELAALVPIWLDACEPDVRLALLKLLTGRSRSIATGAVVRAALAALGDLPVGSVEQVWHGQAPPYGELFAWLEGNAPRPSPGGFQPFMLADLGDGDGWLAEPLWRGDRIRIANGKIFSRHADDISSAHPDWCVDGVVLDGIATGEPPTVRLFDILFEGTEDLRPLGFSTRRARLEAWFARVRPFGMALSDLVPPAEAGVVLKRPDSPYIAGRLHGFWVKRPHPPRMVAAVLLYAETGLYTVGLRRDGALVPVGQATAWIAAALDEWVRDNTVARFGPVREVAKTLIVSVAYDSVRAAPRRKAGIVLEGARIVDVLSRTEADDLDAPRAGV
jgi:DNA ligase-1